MSDQNAPTLDGSAETPGVESPAEAIYRVDLDTLRRAGASLGRIESSTPPPRMTFDELAERAEALRRRIAERGAA